MAGRSTRVPDRPMDSSPSQVQTVSPMQDASVDRLGQLPCSLLPPELAAELLEAGQKRLFPKNTIVVHEGEPADTLYLVLEGRLRVYVSGEDGRELELNRLGPGEHFGEMMLGGRVRTASVRTLSPARLCLVSRGEFQRILAEQPALAFHLIQSLIARVTALTERVRSLALMDVYGRVAKILLDSAVPDGELQVVPGPLSQQQIAERIGSSRSMVNRILRDLGEGGYISISRERIVLHRPLPKRW